jgi:hypothetical protein
MNESLQELPRELPHPTISLRNRWLGVSLFTGPQSLTLVVSVLRVMVSIGWMRGDRHERP